MDTVPLPAVPDRWPPRRPGGALRALLTVAGGAAGGMLLIGLGLVVLQLTATRWAPGTGLAAAAGPTWPRALAQLAVGVIGEGAVRLRPRMGRGAQVWAAALTIVATVAVVWWAWWA